MAFDYSRLTEIMTIATGAASIYSNPAATKSYIRQLILHNGNTTNEDVILYNVPDSGGSVGTAGATNIFYKENMAPDDTTILDFGAPGIILEDINDSIQAVTDTVSKVTIQIYGGTE
jgi:hypothetical protein